MCWQIAAEVAANLCQKNSSEKKKVLLKSNSVEEKTAFVDSTSSSSAFDVWTVQIHSLSGEQLASQNPLPYQTEIPDD